MWRHPATEGSDGGEQRRLAAIVSADVTGYSRLMGQDESVTLAARKLFEEALRQDPTSVPALLGLCYLTEDQAEQPGPDQGRLGRG